MLKNIIIFLTLLIFSNNIFANKEAIIKNFSPFLGTITKDDIIETEFKGISEVLIHNPIGLILVSNDGKFVIRGDVFDVVNQRQIKVSNRVYELRKKVLGKIDDKDKIIFKADKEKYAITVFTDVDCPHCRRLHSKIKQINDLGITVKYTAFPIVSLHPKAFETTKKIWCSDDRKKAMNDYKKYDKMPKSNTCKNNVEEQILIGDKLGIQGTPAIFLSDGSDISGYIDPQDLFKIIEERVGK
jgi:thiol:disulfide interchange protein DsbC